MLFFLATPEYNQVQSNTTKIKVHLSSGVAEIYDQHQDLMGRVDNNLLEIVLFCMALPTPYFLRLVSAVFS